MYTHFLRVLFYAHHLCCLKVKDRNTTFEDLKKEVLTLRGRCDHQEEVIKDLQSRCETHENVLEMLRKEIVSLHDSQKTLSTMYCGENYELAP